MRYLCSTTSYFIKVIKDQQFIGNLQIFSEKSYLWPFYQSFQTIKAFWKDFLHSCYSFSSGDSKNECLLTRITYLMNLKNERSSLQSSLYSAFWVSCLMTLWWKAKSWFSSSYLQFLISISSFHGFAWCMLWAWTIDSEIRKFSKF